MKLFAKVDILMLIGLFILTLYPHQSYWNYSILLVVCVLIIALGQMRYTEIDDSGGCIAVRKMHPFSKKGYFPPKLEFPYSAIHHYTIKKSFLKCNVKILIQGRTMKKNINLNLLLFNKQQIYDVNNLFEKCRQKNF